MSRRRYKIQEVIKRGQILLIQVVKEERGNKGAAMTTYLSLAGRYCVLMPNTPRGGGISRKIANGSDRKRLKTIVSEFDVPQGMGVIVRTAGAKRTKTEIKRDYDYLCRLWETTRETTLKSIAPALIHEEGNLVKRSIRDLYNKEISEVLVQGDEAYKTAKSFIKMLMPSHAKNVKAYKDPIPLFLRYQVEKQLEDSMNSVVQLKSGGYLVIHPTEALVSVDVNSGRSTKERNVERTALKTNLEAAEEVARQMRLRDLAGLIVIDFIDMDENRNNRAVEKRMKEALSQDRARVQSSRISQFGLMEISRQRRRRSLLEGSTAHCEHCQGVGRKRTVESSALCAIRAIEEVGARGQARRIRITVAPDVLLYLVNDKRDLMRQIDERYQMFTEVIADPALIRPEYGMEVLETGQAKSEDPLAVIEKEAREQSKKSKRKGRKKDETVSDEDEDQETTETHKQGEETEETDTGKRRRRRGRRGGRRRKSETSENTADGSEEQDDTTGTADALEVIEPETEDKPKRGRRKKAPQKDTADAKEAATTDEDAKPKRKRRKPKPEAETPDTTETSESDTASEETKPRSTARRKAPARKPKTEAAEDTADTTDSPDEEATDTPPKSTARRKAPGRKRKSEEEPSSETPEPTDTPNQDSQEDETSKPARSTTRRKAPSRKKAPVVSDDPVKSESEDVNNAENSDVTPSTKTSQETPARSTTRRKAPPRRKPSDDDAPDETSRQAAANVSKSKTDTEEKPAKRGWFKRKKKD